MSHTKTKFGFLIVVIALLSLMVAACGGGDEPAAGGADTSETRTLTDGLGHEVKVPAQPQRILASYLEDHLVALGVKPVAQWSVSNGIQEYLQTELGGIPTIAYDLPFEAVTSFAPDLIVIGSSDLAAGDKYAQYAKIAPTYVLGDEINNDWRQALLKMGEVLNKSDEAQKALDDYDAKAREAKAKLREAIGNESAAVLWLTKNQFFIVSENQSSGAVLYGDLGLTAPEVVKEISASGTASWNSISLEKLAQLDADHLFLVNSDNASGSKALQDPVWKSIPAVKNGHLYEFDRTNSWLYYGAVANSQIIDDVLASLVK